MITRYRASRLTAIASLPLLLFVLLAAGVTAPQQANADKWAAPFIGGMIGGHVLTNFARRDRERTAAMQEMAYDRPPTYRAPAYSAPAPAPAPAPAAAQSSTQSIESKLNTLDQLAAKGYITKEEYQARRTAILNSL